jgi:beta-lactamase superfamily II metal-dependent hydrolase
VRAAVFHVEMLPAQQGDALWIEYGEPGSIHRILIDGGTPPTIDVLRKRIRELPEDDRTFELLIITHIDTDHIGGALKLLADTSLGVTFGDVWFNDLDRLPDCPTRGPIDGAIMTWVLEGLGVAANQRFYGKAVVVPDDGELPHGKLDGGMEITLLSPGTQQLANLRCTWETVLRKAGLSPKTDLDKLNKRARAKGVEIPRGLEPKDIDDLADTTFVRDRARANGSTIAVLAEYGGRSCILAGDGFSDVLTSSLGRLRTERGGELSVDAFKLPHHGSRRNVSVDLVRSVACPLYLFSTDGSVFGHPDQEAVARVIRYGGPDPTLAFNYRSKQNGVWDDPSLMERFGYDVRYPADGQAGLAVDLDGSSPTEGSGLGDVQGETS